MDTLVQQVDTLIENEKLEEVPKLLSNKDFQQNKGVVEFCWGRFYNVNEEYEEALEHLHNAIKEQYENIYVYGEIALASDNLGRVNEAENAYLNMYKLEQNPKYRWGIMSVLADFYETHHMFLKMEKIGKKIHTEYPSNYQGYHVMARAKMQRKQYKECEMILEKVPDGFKIFPQYVDDMITCLEFQNKYKQILEVLDSNPKFTEHFSSYASKKRIYAYSSMEMYEEAENCLLNYVFETGDMDAIISLAILLISKQEYKKAIAIGNLVLENISEDEIVYDYYARLVEVVGKYLACVENNEQSDAEEVCEAIRDLIVYLDRKKILAKEVEQELDNMKCLLSKKKN